MAHGVSRWRILAGLSGALLLIMPAAAAATAFGDFLALQRPPRLGLTIFASGYGNDQFGSTYGGAELEQSLTRHLGLVAVATAFQIWKGTGGYDSPLTPAHKSAPRNFGRFEGGLEFLPFQGTSFTMLGGEDVGDSHAPVVHGILSTWLAIHSFHPLNLALDGWHYYQNGLSSGRYDIRVIARSEPTFLLLAGIGGAVWGGGTTPNVKTHGGLDLGAFVPGWHLDLELQGGYGTSHTYGIVSISRHFSWDE